MKIAKFGAEEYISRLSSSARILKKKLCNFHRAGVGKDNQVFVFYFEIHMTKVTIIDSSCFYPVGSEIQYEADNFESDLPKPTAAIPLLGKFCTSVSLDFV